ncbi:hypothetical protein [Nonomuraea cavernae]|uniref:Uncharacterized protein n=1 Tax=Nonomuraea cavernae TaxID=2045107 RepID=A0A918DGG5_9ACTN|nr:hypothetical protein [Nonomuraea cavernae]MCA2184651.1 hypothetical protein [Nonomuraea cavernae]GGO63171.1 hypothetical protein GCM10012289_09480 [Nonomuraea cavernae]
MADFTFNVAKGRVVEFYRQVKADTPTGAALVVVVLAAASIEADAAMNDRTTLADVLSASSEASNAGYARKALVGADLAALVVDNTNDRVDLDIPDLTYANVQAAGGDWGKILICFRPGSVVPDAQIIPVTAHDFPMSPDGANIIVQTDAIGFYRAT